MSSIDFIATLVIVIVFVSLIDAEKPLTLYDIEADYLKSEPNQQFVFDPRIIQHFSGFNYPFGFDPMQFSAQNNHPTFILLMIPIKPTFLPQHTYQRRQQTSVVSSTAPPKSKVPLQSQEKLQQYWKQLKYGVGRQ